MECQYCEKILKTKWSLKNHQKTAKYCLKIQGKNTNFQCEVCNKYFSKKINLKNHIDICKKSLNYIKKLENKNIKLLEKNKNIEKELEESKKQIQELKKKVERFEDKLENIAVKAVSRPTTTNNNSRNVHINNLIQNLQPIKNEDIENCGQHLTLDHHREGAEGYARFALDVPFKEKLACVDVNRKKFKYKDDEGKIVEDEGFHKMFKKFCKAVLNKSYDFSQEHYDLLVAEFGNKYVDDNFDSSEYTRSFASYSGTNENPFCKKIINIISKNTKV